MSTNFYLSQFESALAKYREIAAQGKSASGLLYFAGPILGATALKVYKTQWASDPQNPLTSPGRIFFSVWVTDSSIKENKLLYNIHALKLRQFKNPNLTARDFAARFRARLKPHQHEWPNLSLDYGPLTLMQGWIPLNDDTLEVDIITLIQKFITLVPIIDQTLAFGGRT